MSQEIKTIYVEGRDWEIQELLDFDEVQGTRFQIVSTTSDTIILSVFRKKGEGQVIDRIHLAKPRFAVLFYAIAKSEEMFRMDFEKMAEASFPKEGLGVLFSCIKNEVITIGN